MVKSNKDGYNEELAVTDCANVKASLAWLVQPFPASIQWHDCHPLLASIQGQQYAEFFHAMSILYHCAPFVCSPHLLHNCETSVVPPLCCHKLQNCANVYSYYAGTWYSGYGGGKCDCGHICSLLMAVYWSVHCYLLKLWDDLKK